MVFYILLFLVCIGLNVRVNTAPDVLVQPKINLSFLAFTLLVLVIGLRYGFGIDYPAYLHIFEHLGNSWSVERLEPGFYFLNWTIKSLGGPGEALIFVCFLISMYFLNATIQKYSPYPELSYLVFLSSGLIFFYTSGIRQAIAISLCFFAFRYVLEKRLYHFLGLLLLAMTFHFTALIFLPIYFLTKIKFNRFLLVTIYLISLVPVFKPMLIFEIINPVVDAIYGDRFSHILREITEIDSKNTGLGLKVIFYNALTLFAIYIYKDFVKDSNKLILINMFIFSMLATNVFGGIPDIARLTLYYTSYMILFIPVLVASFQNRHLRLTMYLLFFGALFVLMVRYIQTDVYFAVPYRSILFQ